MPASLAKAQYKKYERSPAQTDYLEFEGRPHLHMVGDGLAGGRRGDRQLARRRARRALAGRARERGERALMPRLAVGSENGHDIELYYEDHGEGGRWC